MVTPSRIVQLRPMTSVVRPALVLGVLRQPAEHGLREDACSPSPIVVAPMIDDMADELDAVADHRIRPDMAERTDVDALAELGARLDHGERDG